MSKQIWKFEAEIGLNKYVQMPVGAEILSVQSQVSAIAIWANVDTDAAQEQRQFSVYGTGHDLPESPGEHLGTAQTPGGFVWHIFEIK